MKPVFYLLIAFLSFLSIDVSAQQYSHGLLMHEISGRDQNYNQSWATRSEFPKDYIKEAWNSGKYITDITCTDNNWSIVVSENPDITNQGYQTSPSFPKQFIQEKWDEGMNISSIAYGNGLWAVVMTEYLSFRGQSYRSSSNFPSQYIDQQKAKGYRPIEILYAEGKWLVTTEKYSSIYSENSLEIDVSVNTYFPEKEINDYYQNNWMLITSAYGDGKWITVYERSLNTILLNLGRLDKPDKILVDYHMPKTSINEGWQENKSISQLFNIVKEDEAEIHLIVFSDTDDNNLGSGAKQVNKVLSDNFTQLAKLADMPLRKHFYDSKDFYHNSGQVDRALDNLSVDDEDVVVFYFFGHGFRYKDQQGAYPYLFAGKNGVEHPNNAGISLAHVYHKLKDKGARLSLVFGEVCNSEINLGLPQPEPANHVFPMSFNVFDKEQVKKLFVEAEGEVIMSSSQPGQYSYATSTGGYFFNSFIDVLQYEASNQNKGVANWEDLMQETVRRVQCLSSNQGRKQTPQYYNTISTAMSIPY
ncbi:MAG: caspase family protein [Bacteroidota bacterium]